MKAYEVHRYVWDDDMVEGGRFVRELVGVVLAETPVRAHKKVEKAGYTFGRKGLDTYYEVSLHGMEIIE